MADPADALALSEIAALTGRAVRPAVASRPALDALLEALPLGGAVAEPAGSPLRAELGALKQQLADAEAHLQAPGARAAGPYVAALEAKLAEAEAELEAARSRVREAKEVSAELETARRCAGRSPLRRRVASCAPVLGGGERDRRAQRFARSGPNGGQRSPSAPTKRAGLWPSCARRASASESAGRWPNATCSTCSMRRRPGARSSRSGSPRSRARPLPPSGPSRSCGSPKAGCARQLRALAEPEATET